MKLVNKISSYFLFSSVVVFIVLSFLLYLVISNAITNELDEQLMNISNKVVKQLELGQDIEFPPPC